MELLKKILTKATDHPKISTLLSMVLIGIAEGIPLLLAYQKTQGNQPCQKYTLIILPIMLLIILTMSWYIILLIIKTKPFLYPYSNYLYDSKYRLYCTGCKNQLQPSRFHKWGKDNNAAFLKCPKCDAYVFMEDENGNPVPRKVFIELIKKAEKS